MGGLLRRSRNAIVEQDVARHPNEEVVLVVGQPAADFCTLDLNLRAHTVELERLAMMVRRFDSRIRFRIRLLLLLDSTPRFRAIRLEAEPRALVVPNEDNTAERLDFEPLDQLVHAFDSGLFASTVEALLSTERRFDVVETGDCSQIPTRHLASHSPEQLAHLTGDPTECRSISRLASRASLWIPLTTEPTPSLHRIFVEHLAGFLDCLRRSVPATKQNF